MRNVISVSKSVLATMHSHSLPLQASLSKTNSKIKTSDTNTHHQFHSYSYLLSFNLPSINEQPHLLSLCNANFNFPRSSRSRLPTYINAVQRCSSPIRQSHSENGLAALSSSRLYKNYKGVSSSGSSETFADKLNRGDLVAAVSLISFDSLLGILKFTLLFGIISIHYTYPALAVTASDYATGFSILPFLGDLSDISTSFASAFLLIFFSELGDKTFFIAALLAARNSVAVVFTGTFGALAAMTIISVVLGRTFHYIDEILPFRFGESDIPLDDIAAVCLLVYFGISTLLDATSSDNLKVEDEQKEAELAVSEFSGNGSGVVAAANTLISTFLLVFVAEWGDKSFFSTIALAAASSPVGVIAGALAGHGVATLLAVLGGSLLGAFLSEKVIAYIGGVLFLIFAVVTLVEILT